MTSAESRPLVLGIIGSPRSDSNSEVLLSNVLEGAAEAGAHTDLVRLQNLSFSSCRHCEGCYETGRCVVQDDMQEV